MTDSISGLKVGRVNLTIADEGAAITIAMSSRLPSQIDPIVLDVTITVEQSARLRRMLAGAEKRANLQKAKQ
jgi:hypothetical protein